MRPVILWDFDGTLAFRHGLWSGTLAEVLKREEPEWAGNLEAFRPFLSQGFPWHAHETPHTHLDTAEAWWGALESVFVAAYRGIGLPTDKALAYAKAVSQQYVDVTRWALFEDTIPTLQALTALGFRHAILSNHVPELEMLVAQLGLATHVDAIFNSAWVGYEKPHPAIFQHALRELGRPERVWMVGDSLQADVIGAQRCGIPAILVRKDEPSADRQVLHLQDVIGILTEEAQKKAHTE